MNEITSAPIMELGAEVLTATSRLYGDNWSVEWTADILAELRRLIEDKNTASEIASKLSQQFGLHVTRSAVAGKAHRLHLAIRGGNKRSPNYTVRIPRPLKAPRHVPSSPQRHAEHSARIQLREATKMGIAFDWQTSFVSEFGLNPVRFIEANRCRYPLHTRADDGCLMCCNDPIALPGEVTARVKRGAPLYCVGHALIATNPRAE